MAGKVKHEGKALLLGKGASISEVLIWENAACRGLDFGDMLPALMPRPSWDSSPEQARMDTETLKLQRLDLPPAVQFSRGSDLVVTSVHAAKPVGQLVQRGAWVSVDDFLQQADEQWQAVLLSLVSQVRHALITGFVSLPSLGQHLGPAAAGLPRQQASTPSTSRLRALAIRPILPEEEEERKDGLQDPDASRATERIVTCSGYDEAQDQTMGETSEASPAEADSSPAVLPTEGPETNTHNDIRWVPGQVATIGQGGSDVQRILDSPGLKLGIVYWHAGWVEASLEAAPFMQRLATRFWSVAVMHLDVEASMASKLLSYEKVLTRSESRRRGAKPVLKNGASFPCLTVHEPSNLVPMQTFTGREALDGLAQLLAPRTHELTQQPATFQAAEASPDLNIMPTEEIAPRRTQEAGNQMSASIEGAEMQEASSNGGKSEESRAPEGTLRLRSGAREFKQILNKAKQNDQGVLVLWISGTSGAKDQTLAGLAGPRLQGNSNVLWLEIDITLSRDNRQLAGPLNVKAFPTVQAYHKMKLLKGLDSRSAEFVNVQHAVSLLLDSLTAEIDQKKQPEPLAARSAAIEQHPSNRGAAEEPSSSSSSSSRVDSRDTSFDPPKKKPAAEAGAKKLLRGRNAIFWPKMPCLQCGCPWWHGEDWDARCARCGWTAEKDGYDDDSQPLPAFRAKYTEFTTLLKAGRTADYEVAK